MSVNSLNNQIKFTVIGIIIGGLTTFCAVNLITHSGHDQVNTEISDEKKPIYWVAPMDANYRKDKPGKSPMGMNLVAVYDDGSKGLEEGPGTIRIAANVVNNLGVRTTTAKYKYLQTEIKTVGYVAYDEDKLVHIHPRVEGWIEKLYIKAAGDPVEKNQPLYDIYSPELVNAQEELLLALDRKNTRLINASENRLTALKLPKTTIIKLKKTRKVHQTITFYSPQNGVIENLKIREGFYVKPGYTLMSIGDLSEVWVEAEVFERQAVQVKTGTPVTMKLDYLPGKTWQGQVDYIYPTLDAKMRTVKVRLRFKNESGEFKPNMFAQITIHTRADKPSLLIPKEALIRTGSQNRVVIALGEGSFKSVEVSVGRFDSENVEILTGLNVGEKIVSSAQFLLDSESSKSSDFMRMKQTENKNYAKVTGTINSLMVDHGMVNISREAIEKWNRPAAAVDFITEENVNLSGFTQGMRVTFTFEVRNGNFVIIKISKLTNREQHNSPSNEDAVADHSNH